MTDTRIKKWDTIVNRTSRARLGRDAPKWKIIGVSENGLPLGHNPRLGTREIKRPENYVKVPNPAPMTLPAGAGGLLEE